MNEAEIFDKLHALNDVEVLEHLPKKYLDLTPSLEKDLLDSQKDIVLFGPISSIKTVRGAFSIIRFVVHTFNKELQCIIYNQPFYSKILSKNKKYLLITKYKPKTKTYVVKTMINEDSPYLQTKLKPIYMLPKQVTQVSFSQLVSRIIKNRYMYVLDVVPQTFVNRYRLEPRIKAFEHVHFPTSKDDLKQGLRVFKYEEALRYCLSTSILKRTRKTIKKLTSNKIENIKIKEFIQTLPFKLTYDQRYALKEIVDDMNKSEIMYRLLQGDVGTGKTIVAILALYANYLRGGQGVLLAPTQILASQHYFSALKTFEETNIHIALLTGKLKVSEKKKILQGIQSGEINIVIGTHSLLSENIKYANLNLAIIDEQQNFGVEQRNAIINKGINTDLLMMSATPIPRTLSKVMNSDLDVSTLHEFPSRNGVVSERKVTTRVVQSNDPSIHKAIKRALEIGRQVFIVAPKIVESNSGKKIAVETIYSKMVSEYGEDNVALLHGRMKEEERNEIYADFKNGKKLILVATSIIEVGIDIPSACLMIIYSASCFGLSSLHQLRGRIGRNGESALALLVHDDDEDNEGYEALKYLAAHDDGFLIASFDLRNRGAGSLTGTNQSGDSELQVANFVTDSAIFEQALKDSEYILDHLEVAEYHLYYNDILKRISEYHID